MKLRLLTAIAVVCTSIVACDNAPNKEGADEKSNTETTAPDQNQQQEQMADPNNSDNAVESADVTDEELEQLADLSEEFQQINQQAQSEMMEAVEASGLKVDRYTEIQQSSQNPNAESDATEEEMKKFEQANENLDEIQDGLQEQMVEILEDAGLSEQWYQNITSTLRENEGVLNRYQQIMQERMPQQGQPQQTPPQ